MTLVFPLVPGEFYDQTTIRKKLSLGLSGGIRPSMKNKLVAVFMNAHEPKPLRSEDKFGRVNVYHDYYDHATGLYHYTGAGQIGDQKITSTNRSLADAKLNERKIHFFRQYNVGSKHQYVGEVEVVGRGIARQKDLEGKDREVIVFYLRPFSEVITSEEEATSREVESEISILKKPKRTISEIESDIDKINKKIQKVGPKKGIIYRNEEQNKREKVIVTLLKERHEKCMVCNVPHFKKENNATYSEVHHLVPWSTSFDDSRENLVVLCPTCHKKFDHAKTSEKISMYKQLLKNFPDLKFRKPRFSGTIPPK